MGPRNLAVTDFADFAGFDFKCRSLLARGKHEKSPQVPNKCVFTPLFFVFTLATISHAEQFEFPVQGRSLHAYEAGSLGNIP